MTDTSPVTAAVLLIGDELLSGRTQDTNLGSIARALNASGVEVREARVVPDIQDEIVLAVNTLRARYDYLFTTGGIGPTHDDITADAIGAAFGLRVSYHPQAYAMLEAHYPPGEFTEARKRMTRTPEGAVLIANPVSKAPGFQIGNVFVMAGIPRVMQAMLEDVLPRLRRGQTMLSASIAVHLAEGQFGTGLAEVQGRFPGVSIGSYPFQREGRYGASIVIRSRDRSRLAEAAQAVRALLSSLGGDPRDE
jgi:molybdenum cofactor synthesis domain-containing protein